MTEHTSRAESDVPTPIEIAQRRPKEERRGMPRLMLSLVEGITESDMAILRALASSRNTMTIGELTDATGYTRQTVRRRVKGLKMNDEIREGGLLAPDEEFGGIWFKSVEIAEMVGEYFDTVETFYDDE